MRNNTPRRLLLLLLLPWLEMELDKSCCQGHSSAFAQPWLSKAERAQALETPSGELLHSACGESAEGKRDREEERERAAERM